MCRGWKSKRHPWAHGLTCSAVHFVLLMEDGDGSYFTFSTVLPLCDRAIGYGTINETRTIDNSTLFLLETCRQFCSACAPEIVN